LAPRLFPSNRVKSARLKERVCCCRYEPARRGGRPRLKGVIYLEPGNRAIVGYAPGAAAQFSNEPGSNCRGDWVVGELGEDLPGRGVS